MKTLSLLHILGLAAVTALGFASSGAAPAQQQPPVPQASQLSDVSIDDANSVGESRRNTLSAAQIDDIVQQRPELVIELKALLAEQAQQQGSDLLAGSITDAQLFSQIATSANLRGDITTFLLSRGYVSQSSLNRSLAEEREEDSLRPHVVDPTITPADELNEDRPGFRSSNSAPQQKVAASGTGISPGLDVNGATEPQSTPRIRIPLRSARQNDAPPATRNVTDEPDVLRLPAPYNLLAMRDLYTQVPQDSEKLKRFGSDVFVSRNASDPAQGNGFAQHDAPLDLPIGPDYILGTGDSIIVNLWGGISQSLTRTVDREGKISLPEAGSVVIVGLSLARAQDEIESALKKQFRDAKVDLTIARLRTVRIYVVGDVQRPGAYDLSSLATPLNALYAAGGPTSVGSLRIVRHYRGQQLIRQVDLYDFLLHGLRMDNERLEGGDTLLIPPAGAQVALFGAVKRPAIYELEGDETLAAVLEDAGGATVAAALNHITIERIQPNKRRETLALDQPSSSTAESTLRSIAAFEVKDGDRIHVAPVLPYSERAIYLEGHVARPGKLPYREGMRLNDVLRSYQDLLPEPASSGDIIRLVPPDLHAETVQFDVAEVLIGNFNVDLHPFDTIHIYGRYQIDAPKVTIQGEVLRPGAYDLSRGMTTGQLVKMAGGFKRDALLETADLTSYTVQDGKKVISQRTAISIGAAVNGADRSSDVKLNPGDILTIHQISGWADIGASVQIEGEVTYPGSYGLQEGEHLSSVLRRAGSFRSTAYADGAILIRTQVKQLENKTRLELIHQIESTSTSARVAPGLSSQDQNALLQAAAQQKTEVLQSLRNQTPVGRLVIHIDSDINNWANTSADIELRSGDILSIPKRPGFVLVSGQVYNPSAVTYVPGKSAAWYLQHAGGTNEVASKNEIFIVRANGSVIGRRSGGVFSGSVLSNRLEAGDVVVVPQKIIGGSLLWRNLLTIAQLSSSIAITAAVAGVF